MHIFDVQVVKLPSQCYRQNEMEKKRAYDERVRKTEHRFFTPLVFGRMSTTATVVYKRIASMIAEKHDKPFSNVTSLTARWYTGSSAD